MKAYFLSGLGADKRAFYKIQLPAGYDNVHLDWIPPLKNESLTDYAKRFSAFINPGEDFILVGLSFGGMLACEIAKLLPPKKLIIISSMTCCNELPWYFKWAGKMGLHKFIPIGIMKQATIINRFMGAGTRETKAIVYEYVRTTDPKFIRWALHAIMTWRNNERFPGLVQIHGSKDHLLPRRYVHADYIIPRGGHLMVLNKPDEVNKVLQKLL